MNSIPADLQQNISITLQLTFLHNYVAIFYFVGLIFSIIWSLYRPSRAATFAFIGFGLLLFSFEYTKHILEPLKEQTENSVITMTEHHLARRILDLWLVRLTPVCSVVFGFISLIISALLSFKNFSHTPLRFNFKSENGKK